MVQSGAPFARDDFARHLESRRIATRMLFGGNLLRQSVFTQLMADAQDAGHDAPF